MEFGKETMFGASDHKNEEESTGEKEREIKNNFGIKKMDNVFARYEN